LATQEDDWGDLPAEPELPPDIEALRITRARDLNGLPLGCRMELLTDYQQKVSIGMRKRATFDWDEWMVMVVLFERGEADPRKLERWCKDKAFTKGEFRNWLDRDLELAKDYATSQESRTWPTTVGEVLDAWKLRLTKVATEF
jgi:hypothetical protein